MSHLNLYLSIAWLWVVRFWGACTVLALAMRAIPEDRFVAFEKAYPRLGSLARAVRKAAFDLIPFVQSVVGALVGARRDGGGQ